MDALVSARLEAGAQASAEATGRLEERSRALLAQAIRRDRVRPESRRGDAVFTLPSLNRAVADRPAPAVELGGQASEEMIAADKPSGPPGAEAAERALELVEQVQTFLRSGRPALSLTLRGAIAGRVEVQRVGAGKVALRFESRRRPGAGELAKMRSELQRRGLTVQSMDVASFTWRGD